MYRKIISVHFLLAFAAASIAKGQTYTGAVLYPLASGLVLSAYQAAGGNVVSQDGRLWNGPSGNEIDLTPNGFLACSAWGIGGGQEVGAGYTAGNGNIGYALLWTGTAASAINLNPSGFAASAAWGTNGSEQVGYGNVNTSGGITDHALLWHGTAASAVDLGLGRAYGTDGSQQVGYDGHARLWSGSAASEIDLNPSGFSDSSAVGIGGTQEVGYGNIAPSGSSINHALLLYGTAASAVDLNPAGFAQSFANETNGTQQVGEATAIGSDEYSAMLWSGTAASAVDLQSLLPSSGTWVASNATTIDTSGNVFGVAEGTYNNYTGAFAVEWSLPEPVSSSLLALSACGLLMRRRRK
jgi:hypothetical protein